MPPSDVPEALRVQGKSLAFLGRTDERAASADTHKACHGSKLPCCTERRQDVALFSAVRSQLQLVLPDIESIRFPQFSHTPCRQVVNSHNSPQSSNSGKLLIRLL